MMNKHRTDIQNQNIKSPIISQQSALKKKDRIQQTSFKIMSQNISDTTDYDLHPLLVQNVESYF